MTPRQAIELMLNRMNTRQQFVGGLFGGFDGTTGNLVVQQREANLAISLWQEKRNASGLINLAGMLLAYGNLTEVEYEQIMEALDGDK